MGRELIDIILRISKAGTGAKEATKELTALDKTTEKVSKGFDGMKSTVAKVGIAVGGAAAAFATMKKAYDFGKEGAAILQTRDSFDRLMKSMGVAPGVLGRMSDAALGTVDDMTIMSSTLTLLAGTSEELGSAMMENAPQLLEIAKAAHKLNPFLGDTAFLYQSLATGIKRASPMILDNLGLTIKVGDANEAMAQQLGKSVDQLTAEEKQMALLNDALRAGDRLIEQVGGSTEEMGDSFAVAETKMKNATDSIKASLAPAVADVTTEIAEAIPKVQETSSQLGIMAGAAFEWVKAAFDGRDATQAFNESIAAQIPGIQTVTEQMELWANEGVEPWIEREREATISTEDATEALELFKVNIKDSGEAAQAAVTQYDKAKLATETLAEKARDAAAAEDEFRESMDLLAFAMSGELAGAIEEYQDELESLKGQLNEGTITQDEYAASVDKSTEAFRENTRQIAFNIAEKQILDALEKGLIEDTNASGTAFDEANAILWTLAGTLGLTDQATIDFMGSVQDATGAVIDGKINAQQYGTTVANIADQADKPRQALKDMADQIRNMPEFKKFILEYQTQYTYTGAPPPVQLTTQQQATQSVSIGTAFQHGGQFVVKGPGGVDKVPVMFKATAGEVVTVTPVGGMPPPNPVTNNYNLNVTSAMPSQGIIQDFNIMQALAG